MIAARAAVSGTLSLHAHLYAFCRPEDNPDTPTDADREARWKGLSDFITRLPPGFSHQIQEIGVQSHLNEMALRKARMALQRPHSVELDRIRREARASGHVAFHGDADMKEPAG